MKKMSFWVVGILLLSINMLFSTEVKMLTEDFPPLNYLENGNPVGPSVEIVQAIKENLGVSNKIEVYPWKRSYKIASENPNTCVFSTTRTKARENQFKWVGPLAEKRYVFYALKNSHIKINSIEDAKKYLVGVQLGGASADYLKENNFKQLDFAVKPLVSMKKLIHGRIQLWYTSTTTPIVLGKQNKIDTSNLEEVFTVKSSQLYIAFNKQTPDDVINNWKKEYQKLYKTGKIKAIFQKYHLESLYPKN